MKKIGRYVNQSKSADVWYEKNNQGESWIVKFDNAEECVCDSVEQANAIAEDYIQCGEDSTVIDSGFITVTPIDSKP